MDMYAVWGNPINHSLSPAIHTFFAKTTQQALSYEAKLGDLEQFEQQLKAFFDEGGKGCNVTAPFKERAFKFATQVTERALLAGACNTLKKLPDGGIFGDNTDGEGLVADLHRLGFIEPNQSVLILGAGGATKGVLQALLAEKQRVTIANRTLEKAQALAEQFQQYGEVRAVSLSDVPMEKYDLLINATSAGLNGQEVNLNLNLLHRHLAIYDMQYRLDDNTPLLELAEQLDILHYANGFGMLVSQAALSFKLWRDVMPDVEQTLTHFTRG